MKTLQDFCKYLDENGILEVYLERIYPSDKTSIKITAYIDVFFKWRSSPEGHSFWEQHYDKFRKGEPATKEEIIKAILEYNDSKTQISPYW